MLGKFGIAASFGIIFLYASELLPTVVRSQAMAVASFVAGIGLLAFPYIVFLVRIAECAVVAEIVLTLSLCRRTGRLLSAVAHANHGRAGHSRSRCFHLPARNVGSQLTADAGGRRGFRPTIPHLELSGHEQKVNANESIHPLLFSPLVASSAGPASNPRPSHQSAK